MPVSVTFGGVTEKGASHHENQDSWIGLGPGVLAEKGSLIAACDGVSTAAHGAWAARTTCERLEDFYRRTSSFSINELHDCIVEIDWELGGQGPRSALCTLSLAWVWDEKAYILSMGDTDVFLLRDGKLQQLTNPHGSGASIRSCMGLGFGLKVLECSKQIPLFDGDYLIIMTDGVSESLDKDDIVKGLDQHGEDIKTCASAFVEAAVKNGSYDDKTCVILQYRNS